MQPWTIQRLLEWTAGFFARKNIDPARLSAEQLLSHVLGMQRIKLYTSFNQVVDEQKLAAFRELVKRAAEEEPIAYLTGRAHFFNLELDVTRDVLIPRPDTETLVEDVLQLSRRTIGFETPRVLDLCTGSGCIAAAIAQHHKHAVVIATEISPAAAAVAGANFEKLKLTDRITLLKGDLFEPLSQLVEKQAFDLIVSNPPYIPTAQIASLDRSVRDYEPHLALDGGEDGLTFPRRILEAAPPHLRAGGRLYIEIMFDQADAVRELIRQFPAFSEPRILKDQGGNDRVLTAIRT